MRPCIHSLRERQAVPFTMGRTKWDQSDKTVRRMMSIMRTLAYMDRSSHVNPIASTSTSTTDRFFTSNSAGASWMKGVEP